MDWKRRTTTSERMNEREREIGTRRKRRARAARERTAMTTRERDDVSTRAANGTGSESAPSVRDGVGVCAARSRAPRTGIENIGRLRMSHVDDFTRRGALPSSTGQTQSLPRRRRGVSSAGRLSRAETRASIRRRTRERDHGPRNDQDDQPPRVPIGRSPGAPSLPLPSRVTVRRSWKTHLPLTRHRYAPHPHP